MKITLAGTLLLISLFACASQDGRPADEAEQAIRDFIAVRNLEELDRMRSGDSDGWEKIADKFIIFRTRRDQYLVEFNRRCHELDDYSRIVADRRRDSGYIYARFETLRGCQIARIYGLTEAEEAELEQLGDAPGSRN